jgi:hypothetical protein
MTARENGYAAAEMSSCFDTYAEAGTAVAGALVEPICA